MDVISGGALACSTPLFAVKEFTAHLSNHSEQERKSVDVLEQHQLHLSCASVKTEPRKEFSFHTKLTENVHF